jgi:hypothetical protein
MTDKSAFISLHTIIAQEKAKKASSPRPAPGATPQNDSSGDISLHSIIAESRRQKAEARAKNLSAVEELDDNLGRWKIRIGHWVKGWFKKGGDGGDSNAPAAQKAAGPMQGTQAVASGTWVNGIFMPASAGASRPLYGLDAEETYNRVVNVRNKKRHGKRGLPKHEKRRMQ